MSFKNFRLLCVVFVWIVVVGGTVEANEDSDISITSTSHEAVTYTNERKGALQLRIMCTSSILKILVNGTPEIIPTHIESVYNFGHLFELEPGKNEFEVSVETSTGSQQKTFVIHYKEKPGSKEAEKSGPSIFRLVAILGATYLDNVNNVASYEDRVPAEKGTLTLVPRLRVSQTGKVGIFLRGIALRERYSKEEFYPNEIAYTQLALQIVDRRYGSSELTIELGGNDIRTNNEDALLGTEENSAEVYGSLMWKRRFNKKDNWHVKLELKNKDSIAEVSDPDLDADATVSTMKFGVNLNFAKLKSIIKVSAISTDAEGKYKDAKTGNMGVKIGFPMRKWTGTWSYDYKTKIYDLANPLVGDFEQEDVLQTSSLKFAYKLFKKGQLALDAKSKVLTSNVETSNYISNTTTLSLVYVF